uniref:SRCR domain-containing protein n=1 Tax=Mesocestoides corti TaxID=53468 RepID=A0A5K3FAF9_MESCO
MASLRTRPERLDCEAVLLEVAVGERLRCCRRRLRRRRAPEGPRQPTHTATCTDNEAARVTSDPRSVHLLSLQVDISTLLHKTQTTTKVDCGGNRVKCIGMSDDVGQCLAHLVCRWIE